jgi:hypothetical protein
MCRNQLCVKRGANRYARIMSQQNPAAPSDTNAHVIGGIRTYLRTHFPDVEFTARDDAKTNSVILQAVGHPRYRLEITERFLDSDGGIEKSLGRLQEWNVAEALRIAKTKLVTLATTGLHTSDPRHYLPRR